MNEKVTEIKALRAINAALEQEVAGATDALRRLASTPSATAERLKKATELLNGMLTEPALAAEAARAFLRDTEQKAEGERG